MLAVVVRELSKHQGAFLFDCCVFIARFASSSCYSSAKTRIRPVKSYHKRQLASVIAKELKRFVQKEEGDKTTSDIQAQITSMVKEAVTSHLASPLLPLQPNSLQPYSPSSRTLRMPDDVQLCWPVPHH